MWIEKINGKYRAIERYRDPLTGKDRRVSVTMEKNTASTRKAAERTLLARITEKQNSTGIDEKVTVGELVGHWLTGQRYRVKESSLRTYENSGSQVIRILGRDTLVNRLTARYVNQMLDKHTTTATARNNALANIRILLNWGYSNDYVADIMWLKKLHAIPDRKKVDRLSEKYLESDELTKLLDSMRVDRWRVLTSFLAMTGLRVGEALALEFTDIDLEGRTIHVTKTYLTRTYSVSSPKTASSNRDVYIQDELLPLCRKLRRDASANRLVSPLVFPDHNYDTYYSYIKSTGKKALGKKISPHVLRHTHVALLAEHGVPLDVISRRLGHMDEKITREVYFHVTERLKEKDTSLLKSVSIV